MGVVGDTASVEELIEKEAQMDFTPPPKSFPSL